MFWGITEELTAKSTHSIKVSRQIKMYVLLFEHNTESWGKIDCNRPFRTTLQRLHKLTDSLMLKQEFVQVRQSCKELFGSIYRLGI